MEREVILTQCAKLLCEKRYMTDDFSLFKKELVI
jgi:hypothetical protein